MRLAFIFDNHILQHEPLGPMYIASYVKQQGHDYAYFNADEPDFERLIRNYDPQVISYSIATGQQGRMMKVNNHLREALPKVQFSLFGGPHPTFFQDFITVPGVDGICIGEGEEPTAELLDALEKGDDYSGIKNLQFKMPDGKIIRNENRNFLPNLDELPWPDHTIKDRFPHLKELKTGFFIAGRGCPFLCTFCFNDAMMKLQGGKYVRYRDPEKVCEEIEWVKERYGIDLVSFQDDIFGIQVKWLEKFSPIYAERVKLPFMCHYRADLATERAVKAMYEAGCVRLIVGLESGNAELRERVMDKRVSTGELYQSAENCHKYGIELLTQNMFGIPGETVETALETIELNMRLDVEVFIHYFFTPYPETKLGKIAEEMGLFDGDFDALPQTYHSVIPLNIPDKEVIEQVGLVSYFLIDFPSMYFATKKFIQTFKNNKARLAWLKGMRFLDNLTKKLNMRNHSCWYHDPRPGWRFDEDGNDLFGGPGNPPPGRKKRKVRRAKNGFGVAPNLIELEKAAKKASSPRPQRTSTS